jgi:orotidine-5'-phosphate decarboxylase
VGATYPAEMAALRQAMPEVNFLVPGYGSQGGTAADVAPAFRGDGLGAVVSSSRGVLFPFRPDDAAWEAKIEAAARAAVKELAPFSHRAAAAGSARANGQTSSSSSST